MTPDAPEPEVSFDQPIRVLVVDDERMIRELLASALEDDEFELTFAGTCTEARTLLQTAEGFEVALLDKNLPDGAGLELVSHLRLISPNAEFIILTGYGTFDSAAEALRMGAFEYLTKPMSDLNRLAVLVRNAARACVQERNHLLLLNKLQESNLRYRLVLQGADHGIFDWDIKDNTVLFSQRFQEMLGLNQGGLGQNIEAWLRLVHHEDIVGVRQALRSHFDGSGHRFRANFRVHHHDGTERAMAVSAITRRDDGGQPIRMVGSQFDDTVRRRAEDELAKFSMLDGVTKLPNRQVFLDRLGQSLRQIKGGQRSLATAAIVDIDGFSLINDAFGFAVADKLLAQIGDRLRQQLSAGDSVARLDGARFGMLIDDVDSQSRGMVVISQTLSAFEEPFVIDGQEVFARLSIGVVELTDDMKMPESAVRQGEIALQKAKSAGQARYSVYSNENDRRPTTDFVGLDRNLRRALKENEINPHFQPIVDAQLEQVIGFEALARWTLPDGQIISPGQFIPWAEQSGLIVSLNGQMVDGAFLFLDSLRRLPQGQGVSVSVNMTPSELLEGIALERLKDLLSRYQLDPSVIKVELLESTLVKNLDVAIEQIQKLRTLGVKVGLDDFGTGFSSLSYLHRLELDFFKVDRTFIVGMLENTKADAIVRTIFALGQSLSVPVIAEGIETQEQKDHLIELGCRLMQGYFFSRPVPPDDARAFLLSVNEDVAEG